MIVALVMAVLRVLAVGPAKSLHSTCCEDYTVAEVVRITAGALVVVGPTLVVVRKYWLAAGRPRRTRERVGLLGLVMAASAGFLYGMLLLAVGILGADETARMRLAGAVLAFFGGWLLFSARVRSYWSHIRRDKNPAQKLLLALSLGALLFILVVALGVLWSVIDALRCAQDPACYRDLVQLLAPAETAETAPKVASVAPSMLLAGVRASTWVSSGNYDRSVLVRASAGEQLP